MTSTGATCGMDGEPRGPPDRTDLARLHPGDRGPAEHAGGHVVRMALQVAWPARSAPRRRPSRPRRPGARPQPARRRSPLPRTPDPRLCGTAFTHRRRQPAGSQLTGLVEGRQPGAHDPGHQVGPVRRHPPGALADHLDRDRRPVGEPRLDPVGQVQREAQAVESGTEVGAGRRHLDDHGAAPSSRRSGAAVARRGPVMSAGISRSRPSARAAAATSTGITVGSAAVASAHWVSLSPWPVRVQTIGLPGIDPARGLRGDQPGDRRRRGRLAVQALARGQGEVRREDLVVGDHVDQPAGLVAGGHGELPGRGVADADRGGDRLRVGHRVRRARWARRPRPGSPTSAACAVARPSRAYSP